MTISQSKSQASSELFGVSLDQQVKGFIASFEFLAMVFGRIDFIKENPELKHPIFTDVDENDKRFNQKSHDIARRMACGAPIDDSELDGLFDKTDSDWKETQYIVIRLLKQFLFIQSQQDFYLLFMDILQEKIF